MEVRDIMIGRNYEDKNGQDRTAWTRIGKLFIKTGENGELKISGILEAAPIGGNGSFQAFTPKKREEDGGTGSYNGGQKPAGSNESVPTLSLDDEEDEIKIEDVPF